MWDAILAVGSVGVIWLHDCPISNIPLSGYPLVATIIAGAWGLKIFPTSCYEYSTNCWDIICMTAQLLIAVDFLQFVLHMSIHKGWCGRYLQYAHTIHHKHKEVYPEIAFDTGYLDALLQLVFPMFSVIFIICPDRTSLILFGTIYSHWLLYIHSERINQPQIMNSWATKWDKVCDNIGLVTPMYHALHHRRPDLNFSHFVQWDKLLFSYHKVCFKNIIN